MLKGLLGSSKKKDDWKTSLETLQSRPTSLARSSSSMSVTVDNKALEVEYAIYNAARKGDLKELRDSLRTSSVHINQRDAMGDTALHCACRNGSNDIVSLLLENRASVSAQNNMGMSPLHEAAQAGHAAVVRKLLECGADAHQKRVDGATPSDVAGSQEVRDQFRRHEAQQQTQRQTSSKAGLPVQTRVALNLLASPFLVLPNSIHFGACWMGSDRHVVVCEQALGKVAVIALPGSSAEGSGEAGTAVAVSRTVLNAEAAAMNPEHDVLAWKDTSSIHIRSLASGKDIKLLKLQGEVSFWKWADSSTIALVTDTAVLHWAMDSAQPVRVFEVAPELSGAQVISYHATADGKCFLLGAVLVKPGGAIEGIMQLFSTATHSSEILHGHCGIFASIPLPGADRVGPVHVLIYEDKTSAEFTSLCIREVGRGPTEPGDPFCVASLPLSCNAPDVSKSDFPVTMTYSAAHGLVYMMSRLGYLTLYDVFTAKAIYRSRVTEETVFCAAHHTASGGILAISRKGQILQIGLNMSTVVPYLVEHLGEPQLAVAIASRLGIEGAAQLSAAHHHKFNTAGDVVKYQVNCSSDAGEALELSTIPAECLPVVACIDFGNTHCGIAFAYKVDPSGVHFGAPTARDTLEMKAPSSLLLLEDGRWEFGNDAETKYYEAMMNLESAATRTPSNVQLFRNIQSALKGKFAGMETVMATSVAGKTHPLIDLVTQVLVRLRDFALGKISSGYGMEIDPRREVQWVLTVPVGWNDFSKAFMRAAAFRAGLTVEEGAENLIIVPEPEAAAVAVHINSPESHLISLGNRFLLLDCGGCSVDITVHQVRSLCPLDISAVGLGTGGDWGGDQVNLEFKKFLKELFGAELYARLEQSQPYEFHSIYFAFDQIKVKCDPSQHPPGIRLGDVMDNRRQLVQLAEAYNAKHPATPVLVSTALHNGFLTMSNALMLSFFDPLLILIVQEVRRVCDTAGVSQIAVVGGFGASKVLIERLQGVFEARRSCRVEVICSGNRSTPQTAVAQGGVWFGIHKTVVES